MIDKFENFILDYADSNNYLDIFDDVMNFLVIMYLIVLIDIMF